MSKIKELSIFFPFWNEAENAESVVEKAIIVAQKVADNWEIIMIDDGSSDNTLLVIEKLAKENPNLVVVSHKKNRGYGAALTSGLTKARYDLVVFNDGDGQFDFSEVDKFIEKIHL